MAEEPPRIKGIPAIENIYFDDPKPGKYKLKVVYYSGDVKNVCYTITVHEDKNVTKLYPVML